LLSLAVRRCVEAVLFILTNSKADWLMFCGYRHLQIDHPKRFVQGKVYLNTLEGFWAFAKERLIKFQGVSRAHFSLIS
jgi:transposase